MVKHQERTGQIWEIQTHSIDTDRLVVAPLKFFGDINKG